MPSVSEGSPISQQGKLISYTQVNHPIFLARVHEYAFVTDLQTLIRSSTSDTVIFPHHNSNSHHPSEISGPLRQRVQNLDEVLDGSPKVRTLLRPQIFSLVCFQGIFREEISLWARAASHRGRAFMTDSSTHNYLRPTERCRLVLSTFQAPLVLQLISESCKDIIVNVFPALLLHQTKKHTKP